MTELEPKRLLDARATPGALRDALRALQQQAPSPAAAARIRAGIAKPPSPVSGASSGARWLLSIVLVALTGLSLWSLRPSPAPVAAPQAKPPSPAPLAIAAPAAAPLARIAIEPPPSIADAKPLAVIAEPNHEPESAAPTAITARMPRRTNAVAASMPSARTVEPPSKTPIAIGTLEPVAPRERSAPVPAPAPAATHDDAERVFADPQDEAGLLYRAKRLSSSDPSAALRLLVLHEASFPDGAFSQERDMLEIQIHERLGHAATAKRLAALFKRRYPSSVYRVSP